MILLYVKKLASSNNVLLYNFSNNEHFLFYNALYLIYFLLLGLLLQRH
jgi:hypothetical protein